MKLSNFKHLLPELNALTGLALLETFVVLCCTGDDDDGFPVDCVSADCGIAEVEDGGLTDDRVVVELTFVVDE